ncbi:MAG: hypothetical protein IIB76_11660, partial [Proteobacteria bacterium]|nr:hypothetical protein [Pseudomonadota bacterium]
MKSRLQIIVPILLLTLGGAFVLASQRTPDILSPPANFQRGVALGLYGEPGFSYERHMREIRGLGATHVNLLVRGWMDKVTSSRVDITPTPTDQDLVITIQAAHEVGLHVMLQPLVLLRNPEENDWRGTITPKKWNKW